MSDILAPTWHRKQVANELISFQSRDFATQLIDLVRVLYNESRTGSSAERHVNREKIEKLILEYTGVNIELILDTENPPCCIPLLGNSNHVLNTLQEAGVYHVQEREFADLVKSNPAKVGTFNPSTGKVGGIYSKLKAPVYMGWEYCRDYLSPEEFAAVLMHEIGHCSLAYQFMFRTFRASQLLASLHHVKTGRDTSVTYEEAITLLGKDLTKNPQEFQALLTIEDEKAIAQIVYTRSWCQLGSDFGDYSVTGPNFEALSDNFAIRWGLGSHLATGLYTIMGDASLGATSRTGVTVSYIINTLGIVVTGFVLGIWGTGAVVPALIITALFCVAVTYGSGRADGIGVQQANVYDTPLVRFQRIREGMLQQLKTLKITPELRRTILDEIKLIESFTKNRTEVGSLFSDIARLFPSNWKAEVAFNLERNLESLTQNSLFVDAHKIESRRS
jgi:hypothetical protein